MNDTQEIVDELESAKNWLDLISEKFREGDMLDEAAKTDRVNNLIVYLSGLIVEIAIENRGLVEKVLSDKFSKDRDEFVAGLERQMEGGC